MRRIRLAARVADMLPEFAVKQTLSAALGVHFLYSLAGSLTVFTLPRTLSNLSRFRTIDFLYISSFFLTFGESLSFANLARTFRAFFKLSSFVIGRRQRLPGHRRELDLGKVCGARPGPLPQPWSQTKIEQKLLEWI